MALATILRRSASCATPLAIRLIQTQRHHHSAIFTSLYRTTLSHKPSSIPFLQTLHYSSSAAAKPPSSDESLLRVIESEIQCAEDTDDHDRTKFGSQTELLTSSNKNGIPSVSLLQRGPRPGLFQCTAVAPTFPSRSMTTLRSPVESVPHNSSASVADVAPRIKFKRLDKTAKHIMQILDKEAVEEVRAQREIPDIKPGYIIQLKVVVPENKRRVSILKGIVIARRNAGLNSTFRLRRLVAGVGVESLFPLYSPNIKEVKVLDKKKVRRAKLYYLRDKMNALKKH